MTCGRGSSGRSPDPGRLIGLGYVAPRANPAHRRSVLIALTPSDADVMRRIRADEPRHLAALATDCTQQEIATAAKVLRALDRDVRARAAAPTTPRRDPGEAPIAADAEIYRLTTRDRLMIADVLASFDDTRWYAATLCAGWTVPHVAGHLLQPMMVGFGRFLWTPLRRGAYPVERWRRRPRRPV